MASEVVSPLNEDLSCEFWKSFQTNILSHSVITLKTMFYALIYLLSRHQTEEPAVLLITSFKALTARLEVPTQQDDY